MLYDVYYRDVKIGELEVNANGKHKYTPTEDALKVKDQLILPSDFLTKTDGFVEPIPFFANRIKNCQRFPNSKEIGYQTDNYRLIPVSPEGPSA